jgi:hypothetical protein
MSVVKAPVQLAVSLPDAPDEPILLNVSEGSKLFCRKFPQDEICTRANTDALPRFRLESTTEGKAIANPPGQ